MGTQKSAEGDKGRRTDPRPEQVNPADAEVSIVDGGAVMGTKNARRPWKEAAGSRHEPGLVRQAATAATDTIGPQTHALMEEVLRRKAVI